jgi:L-Ala-D/L-Glu epimerase
VLDLVGRGVGRSAGDVLGPVVRETVPYSGVVSADGADAVRALCERMRALGLRSVKVKVGRSRDEDRAVLQAVRDALGPEVELRIDANCAWSPDEALERLQQLAEFRLAGAEQPVGADDVDGMAWLTARSDVPIIADESLVSAADAERLAAARACHVFNVRVSKCGGMLASRRVREIGARAGIASMLGAQVGETALLSAAGRHFATRVRDVRHFEGSFGELLLERDLAAEPVVFGRGGEAPALTGPGLGVDVDDARLRAFTQPLAS